MTAGLLLCAGSAVVGAVMFARIRPGESRGRAMDVDVLAAGSQLSPGVATAYSE